MSSALFWDTNEAVDPENADYLALQALLAEQTPLERAVAYRTRGNEALRRGNVVNWRNAVAFYTQALEQGCEDVAANVASLANRALAQLKLSNWGKAKADAEAALALQPSHEKAAYRASLACSALGRYAECIAHCDAALRHAPDSVELKRLRDAAAASLAAENAKAAAAGALAAALESRRLRLGPVAVANLPRVPTLSPETGHVHCALLLLYPEGGPHASDLVESVDLCADTLGDHLDAMFGDEASLEWDAAGAYTRAALRVFVRARGAPVYSHAQARRYISGEAPGEPALSSGNAPANTRGVVPVDAAAPLEAAAVAGALQGGALMLYVLAAGSDFAKAWLNSGWEG